MKPVPAGPEPAVEVRAARVAPRREGLSPLGCVVHATSPTCPPAGAAVPVKPLAFDRRYGELGVVVAALRTVGVRKGG